MREKLYYYYYNYIHRIFYLFIVIFYRKFIENTCDKITVVSLALYMYIAYYFKVPQYFFHGFRYRPLLYILKQANFIAE